VPPVTSARSIRSLDNNPAGVSHFPAYFPLASSATAPVLALLQPLQQSPTSLLRQGVGVSPRRATKIAPEQWPQIADRAKHESLRDLATGYGVSHETIRAILRRMQSVAIAIDQAAD